jgi:hypothetical protein
MNTALTQKERRKRIAELKRVQEHKWMLESIAAVTDELERLHQNYALVLPSAVEYSHPFAWIEKHFPTSSVNIVWELVGDARCVRWETEKGLEQAFERICTEEKLDGEAQLVFGGMRPHICLSISSVQAVIGLASDFECEWWMVPRSSSWVMECSRFGMLWFVRVPR